VSGEREPKWHVGQRAIIDRRIFVTIEQVTPAGRAIAAGRTFDVNGIERSGRRSIRRSKLEPLTAEIEAEIALKKRALEARGAAQDALDVADKWVRRALSAWNATAPSADDVDRAERLAAAIRSAMAAPPQPETGDA
jgi:regulator of protease activity HflC (stomatin/prohibitin superfamily)